MKRMTRIFSILLATVCLLVLFPVAEAFATPTYASVSTDKTDYALQENVTFTISSDGASNTLWVYRVDGEWQNYYQNVSTGFTLAFGWDGTYEALVEAWDGTDYYQSKKITFNVGTPTVIENSPPTMATISVSKLVYNIGETVTFTMSSDGNTNDLWIYAPNPNNGRPGTYGQVYQDAGTSYSLTFTTPGQYSALMETWNGVGSFQSQKIGFTIVDPSATTKPTTQPTTQPTTKPTTQPTTVPTTKPTTQPTTQPTTKPTTQPTTKPTTKPTTQPTVKPTTQPTTVKPATQPTTNPILQNPCANGHIYSNGACTVCGVSDPNYIAPTQPGTMTPVTPDRPMDTPNNGDSSILPNITIDPNYDMGSANPLVGILLIGGSIALIFGVIFLIVVILIIRAIVKAVKKKKNKKK